jgi:dTDP-4-dehydrorhamnose reductase
MRILLSGVTGQVGGALSSRLQNIGTVIAADRTVLDLAQPQSIAAALDRLAPELIVNPAAYTAVDKAEDEAALAMRINGEAPGIMARWASDHGVPMIHFSTDYVFDGSGERAWNEHDETRPLSVYGRSKLAGEKAVLGAGGSFLIVRTSWVYAAAGKNFLRTIARLARERAELRIVADQAGAPTSAAIIADAVAVMLSGGLDEFRSRSASADGLVHLAASGETTWHGFAVAIVEGLKARNVALRAEKVMPIKTEDYPTPAKRPRNSRLALSRLDKIFGVTPPDWRTALQPELDALAAELHAAAA